MGTPKRPDKRDDLAPARDAALRGSWSEAYRLFRGIDPESLMPADLDAAADAAWWTRHTEESVLLRQKAYAGFSAEGNSRRAAYSAWHIGTGHDYNGEYAVAAGWMKRAARHLEGRPDCFEHGLLLLYDSNKARERGAFEESRGCAERALELGRRLNVPDLIALSLETMGRAMVAAGNAAEGMPLLDEAMTSVLADEVAPLFTGQIFCDVIGSCMQVADLRRAGEWTHAAVQWCRARPDDGPFRGVCRLYRIEVANLLGEWAEAEEEARHIADELHGSMPYMAAGANYWFGEVLRLRGDFAAAEQAFRRANELGRDPQPGLALVRLAQGKIDAAAVGLRLALSADGDGGLNRARLLAAQVAVSVAAGDMETARAAAAELDECADGAASAAIHATADLAGGALGLTEGDLDAALRRLRRAREAWLALKVPYEATRARVLIGLTCRRAGDEERARIELEAARAAFEQLGAQPDVQTVAGYLKEGEFPGGLSAREVEVLRLVAAGKTNRQIGGEMVISEHTVSRHLQNIFRKLGVTTRAAATAFAFENALV